MRFAIFELGHLPAKLDDLGALTTTDAVEVAALIEHVLDLHGVEHQAKSRQVVLGLLQELLCEQQLVLVDLLGGDAFTHAYGFEVLAEGLANIIGPPFGGKSTAQPILLFEFYNTGYMPR